MTKKALIIDDEEPLLDLISEVLRPMDIECIQSPNGKDAIALAKLHDGFDVIIIDMNMPEMNGKEAYLELQKTNLESPVIFMSGYDLSDKMAEMNLTIPNTFLKKPFSIVELSKVVQSLVNA